MSELGNGQGGTGLESQHRVLGRSGRGKHTDYCRGVLLSSFRDSAAHQNPRDWLLSPGHLSTAFWWPWLLPNLFLASKQGLYCDIRQLVQFIKEAHGNVFRRVALSALLDSAEKLAPGKKVEENGQESKPAGGKRWEALWMLVFANCQEDVTLQHAVRVSPGLLQSRHRDGKAILYNWYRSHSQTEALK